MHFARQRIFCSRLLIVLPSLFISISLLKLIKIRLDGMTPLLHQDVRPLPNLHLLAENMAMCNFAWLSVVVK